MPSTDSAPDSSDAPPGGAETDAANPAGAPTRAEPTKPDAVETTHEYIARETVDRRVFDGSTRSALEPDDLPTRPSLDDLSFRMPSPHALRVPGYQVLGVIGKGGMGVVYKARQLALERLVALKVLPPALAADPARVQRFRNEASVAARLTHSRILPLYDVLEVDGAPVLVMPYVDGCDLERILADRRAVLKGESNEGRHTSSALTARGFQEHVLPLLDQAVDAVAVLHEAAILHRDIKPSNLLVARRGEVFLSDFGLSRLNEGVGLTAPNQWMGTPGYMAPEQWDGAPDVDERADVFGLGATLYKALTLETPYGPSRIDSDQALPPPPSARAIGLSADFDAVILKALDPDRNRRYKSAVALRDDWRRVRAGEEPLARPQSRMGRLVRRASRHPAVTGALVMILLLAGILGWLQRRVGIAEANDPSRPRAVRVLTSPPGARVAVAPLDPVTGDVRLEHPVFPAWGQVAPAQLQLSPGDYFVEVAWDNGHFEQVFRHVPGPDERTPGAFAHRFWKQNAGVIEFQAIKDRELTGERVLAGMERFDGSERFVAPPDPVTRASFGPRRVLPFYLDTTEVTVGQFLRPSPGRSSPPANLTHRDQQPVSDLGAAVRFVEFDVAVAYAEIRGKRLPTEAEYRFASTNGGRTIYPWGDNALPADERAGTTRLALHPQDRLLSHPDVLGLRSNVAEWTTTRVSSFLPVPPLSGVPGGVSGGAPAGAHAFPGGTRLFLVVGAPPSVALGKRVSDDFAASPYATVTLPVVNQYETVGFRCARSAEPYFLHSGAAPTRPK